jgi:hypothetical protein
MRGEGNEMNLQLASLPDDPVELAKWLEPKIAGLDLPELVAELGVLFPPTGAAPKLSDLLGRYSSAVMSLGLSALPEQQIRSLLEYPNRLFDLQQMVLAENSLYWLEVGNGTDLGRRALAGKTRILAEVGARKSSDFLPRPASAIRWMVLSGLATAAAVIIGVWIIRPFAGNQSPTGGWGWNHSGILLQAKTPVEHLERLALGADEWFRKRPASAAELGIRLAEMRRGCSQLILGDHPSLDKNQRDWLVGKCKAWAAKLDDQLAALEAGAPLEEVQTNSDDIVRKLSSALRDKAKESG